LGSIAAMNISKDLHPALTSRPTGVNAIPELIAVTGRRARVVKVVVVICLGLLIWWPLVFLPVAVIVPTIAVAAILVALLAAIAAPIWLLVRPVRARLRAQRSMRSLSRLRP
jgi:hypothetical protein